MNSANVCVPGVQMVEYKSIAMTTMSAGVCSIKPTLDYSAAVTIHDFKVKNNITESSE